MHVMVEHPWHASKVLVTSPCEPHLLWCEDNAGTWDELLLFYTHQRFITHFYIIISKVFISLLHVFIICCNKYQFGGWKCLKGIAYLVIFSCSSCKTQVESPKNIQVKNPDIRIGVRFSDNQMWILTIHLAVRQVTLDDSISPRES